MKLLFNKALEIIYSDKGLETIRYIIIGVATTIVSFGSYFILYNYLFIDPNIANIISIILAVLFAYVTNKIYVFRSKTKTYKELIHEFIKFISSRVVTMVFEVVGVFVLLSVVGLHEMVSKALISIGVLVGNYILAKVFVFKKP